MSYFLDPLALFLLGMILYYVSKRLRWGAQSTVLVGGIVSFLLFMGVSTLLYLDIVDWPLPPTEGPEWMFHTNLTGIAKDEVPLALAVFMLLIYPIWHSLGYVFALYLDMGSILLPLVSYADVRSKKERPETQVVVRRGTSPRQLTREAIEALGGITAFVNEGDRVLIKPNICGGNPQILGSFTSIEIVDELVQMIRMVNADPVVVDSDMIWTLFEPVAEKQGWKSWSERESVPLLNLAKTRLVRFNFGRGSVIGVVPVSRELVDADVIISVPTMKTHLLTNITVGMKNMYGTLPEENKAKYHRLGIEDVIYEVNRAFTPNLTLVDGTIGGEAWGPLSCSQVNFQTVIASNDVVAADAVSCRLIGYDPMSVLHVSKAHEEGLGDANVSFDPSILPYKLEKDGNWEKPDVNVSSFYEGIIEAFLLLPGMQNFFDLAADFVLYGMATIPILSQLTPEVERAFNDVIGGLLRSGYWGSGWTEEELRKLKGRLKIE